MSNTVEVSILSKDQWERLKAIRIRALTENSEAFGQTLEEVKALSKDDWFKYYEKSDYLIASIDEADIGMLYIEVLNGDHGATCWIGGCWTDPAYRGKGVMRALFNYIDLHAKEKDWTRQGLGVWTDNFSAIKAYEYLGFAFAGEKMPGSREGKFFQHMIRNTSL
jgi:RimJ/RimL family protein N-acetyltransferase